MLAGRLAARRACARPSALKGVNSLAPRFALRASANWLRQGPGHAPSQGFAPVQAGLVRDLSNGENISGVVPVIEFDDLVSRMEQGTILLVDVRNPDEVAETGALEVEGDDGEIVKALNIPLPVLQEGAIITMNDEEFEDAFGFSRPKQEQVVAFSCRSGVRSEAAAQFALRVGYNNVLNYKGSAMEWFAKQGKAIR